MRPSFSKKGPNYTHYGVLIRCVREDQSAQTMTMHYLSDGTLTVRFSYRKQEYLIPLMLVLKVRQGQHAHAPWMHARMCSALGAQGHQ